MEEVERKSCAAEAVTALRSRICDGSYVFRHFCRESDSDSNYSKLRFILSSSVTESCNNSVLLLGPRGCGKATVLNLVLADVKKQFPDSVTAVILNGILHGDDASAVREMVKQLCAEHGLPFSRSASSDDNSKFVLAVLRECSLAHRTVFFVLDEFDLFAQRKQRLLYTLLDASSAAAAVVIGISCRLDADELLEKRVRSRFSHRKLLFLPPSTDQLNALLDHVGFDGASRGAVNELAAVDSSVDRVRKFLFCASASSGNPDEALRGLQRRFKAECLTDCSVLEMYMLVCLKRLDSKEEDACNFAGVMREYRSIHESFRTSDFCSFPVCRRAFEHLVDVGLISFAESARRCSMEFRPVRLLVSSQDLREALRSSRSCPAILHKLCQV